MTIQNDNQLLKLTELDRLLAETTKIDEITEIRAKVEALRVYAVNIGLSKDECNEFAMARLKAERKAGQVLLSLPKRNGAREPDTGFAHSTPHDLDSVSKSQSHRWQIIAHLPDELFERLLLERYQSKEEVTTNFFYNAGKIHIMRMKGIDTDKPQAAEPEIDIEFAKFMFWRGAHYQGQEIKEMGSSQLHFEAAIEAWKGGNTK